MRLLWSTASAVFITLGLASACKQPEQAEPREVEPDSVGPRASEADQARPSGPVRVDPSPSEPLGGHVLLRVEGVGPGSGGPDRFEFDDPHLYVESDAGFFRFDLRAKRPKPEPVTIPADFYYLGIHGDELLFTTESPIAAHAVPKSGGEPRLIAEFGTNRDPVLVGDTLVGFTADALVHVPVSGGKFSHMPIPTGPTRDVRPVVRGSAVVWLGVLDPRSTVYVARAPFDRVEVAIEHGEHERILVASWAGDGSIAYLVQDRDHRLTVRRKTGDRIEILLDVLDTEYLFATDDAAWWFSKSGDSDGVWRIGPDRHQFLSSLEPMNYIDASAQDLVWGDTVDGVWTIHRSAPEPAGYRAPTLRAKDVAAVLEIPVAD